MAVKFLQINLGHGSVAQDLLEKTVSDWGIDIVLISEQYRSMRDGWYPDADNRAAIWVASGRTHVTARCERPTSGWTWIEIAKFRIYSVYFSPNTDFESFRSGLDSLCDNIRRASKPVIVGGDFNAKSSDWGSAVTDRRGVLLREVMAQLHLQIANIGDSLTFRRGATGSIVDVTLTSETVANRVFGWKVLEDQTDSDHQYISFGLDRAASDGAPSHPFNLKGWVTRNLDHDALATMLEALDEQALGGETATQKEEALAHLLALCCDSTMPKRRPRGGGRRKVCFWWNIEIANLREVCKVLRRKAQRPNAAPTAASAYLMAKKELRHAIKRSKSRCWEEFLLLLDRDPWGLPYKVVRQKLRGTVADPLLCDPTFLRSVIDGLFPRAGQESSPLRNYEREDGSPSVPSFTVDELGAVAPRLSKNKAPGMDGIPNMVVKAAITHSPEMLLDVFNRAAEEGVFPEGWKLQRLVLIPKPSGGYRPLCLLSGVAKVFERLILERLDQYLEDQNTGLSERQYGFRRGRSTVDAVSHVVGVVRDAWSGSLKASRTVVMVLLDIKNAFNTARWSGILSALEDQCGVPVGLLRLIRSYLSGRKATYVGANGDTYTFEVSMGVPQGSVLGPSLWNVFYDGLLRLKLPPGCSLVAYADDVALLVEHKLPAHIKANGDEALRVIGEWMVKVGLTLAVEKTEAIKFTRHLHAEFDGLMLLGAQVPYKETVRYLGVVLDRRLSFGQHIECAAQKACRVASEVGRLMPNIGGPKSGRRRLYLGVTQSILLYAAPVWEGALSVEKHRRKMASVQRACALRVVCGYRTVSEQAALVLASSPPIDLLAAERRVCYEAKKAGCLDWPLAKGETLRRWQERWSSAVDGAWTRRLIVDLKPWCERKHGVLSYRLTQLLTGHGCFGVYLNRIGKEATAACHHCEASSDDAEHTMLRCPAWASQRDSLQRELGGAPLDVEGVIPQMLLSLRYWLAWQNFSEAVMSAKEEAERVREPMRRVL